MRISSNKKWTEYQPDLYNILDNLVTKSINIILIFGVLGFVVLILEHFWMKWPPVYIYFFPILLSVAILGATQNKIPVKQKTNILISAIFLAAVMSIYVFGIYGIGIVILTGYTALVTIIGGKSKGLSAYSFSLAALITMTILAQFKLLPQHVINMQIPLTRWMISTLSFSMIGLIILETSGAIQNYLFESLDALNDRNQKINETNKVLIQQLWERKRQEQIIKQNREEKVIVLKELHHRVKNNLQFIQSLLVLQSKQVEDPQTLSLFSESCNRIRSMAMVHEELYHTNNFAHVDLNQYMNRLVYHLKHQYLANSVPVQINLNIQRVTMGIDKAIPCGLVVNELVTNSLRHAFNQEQHEAPVIDIMMYETEDNIILTVTDNGSGLPYDTDIQTAESLGLQLVRVLSVDQLDGSLTISRNGGTHFTIKFQNN